MGVQSGPDTGVIMKISSSVYAKAAVVALALAAAGTVTVAQARSDVYFSVGANVAPGVAIGVSNAPVYYPPVYVQPQPVYVQPAPVYYGVGGYGYSAAPVYVRPAPIYYAPAPVYYGGRGHRHHHRGDRDGFRANHRGGWR
jgi:hypothetical protein